MIDSAEGDGAQTDIDEFECVFGSGCEFTTYFGSLLLRCHAVLLFFVFGGFGAHSGTNLRGVKG
jgi:hypothetical protein